MTFFLLPMVGNLKNHMETKNQGRLNLLSFYHYLSRQTEEFFMRIF